ncbi:MAG: hypothetical protein K2N06_11265 [Oscillospiraceae bacterium]|nr:hypothetical protein [Oscillospiraceae bacterium]
MTKEDLYAPFHVKYDALKDELTGNDIAAIRELTLEVHAMVHPAEISGRKEKTVADLVLDYVLDGHQNVPTSRMNSGVDLTYAGTDVVPMAWHLWHIYRIEDLVSNLLIAEKEQVFNADWQSRIGASITDTGNALESAEAKKFCAGLNVVELKQYMFKVGKNTRKIIANLTLPQVKNMAHEENVMEILRVGGVTTDFRSVWLLIYWGRLTVGGMILTPLTDHHMYHLPPCLDVIMSD